MRLLSSALEILLLDMFDPAELRRFVSTLERDIDLGRSLPGDAVGHDRYVHELVGLLERQGRVDAGLLQALRVARPNRIREIDEILGHLAVPGRHPPAIGHRLVIRFPPSLLEIHCVFATSAVLGRSPRCGFALPRGPRRMSNLHARIFYASAQGSFIIEDLRSANGTFLNGERLRSPRPLFSGCRLAIADAFELDVELSGGPEGPALALIGAQPSGRELVRFVLVAGNRVGVGAGLGDLVVPPLCEDGRSVGALVMAHDHLRYVTSAESGDGQPLQALQSMPISGIIAELQVTTC